MTWEVRFDPLALDKKLSFLVQGGGASGWQLPFPI